MPDAQSLDSSSDLQSDNDVGVAIGYANVVFLARSPRKRLDDIGNLRQLKVAGLVVWE